MSLVITVRVPNNRRALGVLALWAIARCIIACEPSTSDDSGSSSSGDVDDACVAVVHVVDGEPRTCCCGGGPPSFACDVGTPGCEGGAP